MLVYQLLKQQMQDELEAILKAYETNMKDGKYTSQFNGQNVDGEYVIEYYKQMLAGFPPGTTEYETINSRLKEFERQYRTDVQNLIINAMNNGTQIDFGLLGNDFQNKGISEVTVSDLAGWADQEIADLIANGESEQADKLSGAVFIAKFNVENDGKDAAYRRGEISAAAYASWLGKQAQASLDAGMTESSEAYRQIMSLQAGMLKTARTEGRVEAYNGYVNTMNSMMGRLDAAATKLFDKYKELGGIYSAQVDGLIAANGGDAYKAMMALADARKTGDEQLGAIYGAIFNEMGTDPEEMGFANAVNEVTNKLTQMQDKGFSGVSPEDLQKLNNAVQALVAGNNEFVANSGISFNTGAGQAAISNLYQELKAAGAYSAQGGVQQDVISGQPSLVMDAFKKLGTTISGVDTSGYEYLVGMANGKFSTQLIGPGERTWFTQAQLADGYITQDEFDAAVGSRPFNEGELTRWINGIVVNATKTLPFPGASGAADMSANSVVKAFLDAMVHETVIKNGGTMVVRPDGLMSVSANPTNVDGYNMARTVMLPTGADGKIRFAKSIPLQIMADEPMNNPAPYNFPVSIQVFNSGGNAGADNTFMVIEGSQGQAHQVPWYQGKKWLETIGIVIDDTSFHTPTENGSSIFVRADDLKTSNPDQWTEAFKNFDNPASQWFWGKTTTGNGLGIISVNENTVSSTYNYGLIGKQGYLDNVISGILSNGRESILAAATELAKKDGKEVDRDYINRAAFNMIPFMPTSNNTSVFDIPLLMKNPKITEAFNTWYPGIKPGSGSTTANPAFQVNREAFPNYVESPYYGPGGQQFPTDRNPNWKWKPQSQPQGNGQGFNPMNAIGGLINNVSSFLGEAFKNKPTMVQKLPVIAAKPASAPSTPTVKVSSYTTGYAKPTATPLSPYSLKTTTPSKPPTTVAKVTPTNPTYTRGVS
jgi:hypothetical protein